VDAGGNWNFDGPSRASTDAVKNPDRFKHSLPGTRLNGGSRTKDMAKILGFSRKSWTAARCWILANGTGRDFFGF